jgi:hypothetical protein
MGKRFSRYSTTGKPRQNAHCFLENHPMRTVASLATFTAIRQHVHETLCAHDNLDPGQAPLFHSVITRQGKPCGLFFQVQGPRLLRTYAVWAGDENRILFYDSKGERFNEVRLTDGPDPLKLAA